MKMKIVFAHLVMLLMRMEIAFHVLQILVLSLTLMDAVSATAPEDW